MIKVKAGIIFFSLFIISGLVLICPRISSKPELNVQEIKINDRAEKQETKEFFFTETEGGRTKWDIRALSAEFTSDGKVRLNKVKISLYEDGEEFLNIKANKGYFNKNNKNVHLEGDVTGITDRGDTFITQSLDWFTGERKIVTDEKVKITSRGMIINAKGLVIYPDIKKIFLKEKVKAEIYGGSAAFPFKFER